MAKDVSTPRIDAARERQREMDAEIAALTPDPALVDYASAAFQAGFVEGKLHTDWSVPLPMPERGDRSDADWASYYEGYLMGSCEP